MRMKYISQIQSNLKRYKTIHTKKTTSSILDGSYNSIYKGKSMNFDELREYVLGDDIKDVDWKASARSQKLLVRQYIAEKKHNVLFILDTNKRMLADTMASQEKREVALIGAGMVAYLVNQNGDYVSSIYATEKSVKQFPFKSGLLNIENILMNYHQDVTRKNESSLETALEYILHNIRRKMIIFIVTDIEGIQGISEKTLKRLTIMHDVLMINISNADIKGKCVYDIGGNRYLPSFFTEDKKLAALEERKKQDITRECKAKLNKFGVAATTIDCTEEIATQIIQLLERHKLEKR